MQNRTQTVCSTKALESVYCRMPANDSVMPREIVLLLSGGLDSAVLASLLIDQGYRVHALTVAYGQRHAIEMQAAAQVAGALGVATHKTIALDLRAIGGSALTDEIEVPRNTPTSAAIPMTYVPARNTILLSLALGYAETLGVATLAFGANAVDYSGYPDCRPAFVEAFARLANVATKMGIEGEKFKILAPLMQMSKAEIIRCGADLGVPFQLTHSCYDPADDGAACGACDSCRLRAEGFRCAGIADPTRYQQLHAAK